MNWNPFVKTSSMLNAPPTDVDEIDMSTLALPEGIILLLAAPYRALLRLFTNIGAAPGIVAVDLTLTYADTVVLGAVEMV